MDSIEQAKQIANESDQLVASLEAAAQAEGGTVSFPNYSSTTISCETDPDTGVVTITTKLYPGETGIAPPPGEDPSPPVEAAPSAVEDGTEQPPPGQVPAQ